MKLEKLSHGQILVIVGVIMMAIPFLTGMPFNTGGMIDPDERGVRARVGLGEGTVEPTGIQKYLIGETATVEAFPAKDWKFSSWYIRGLYVDDPIVHDNPLEIEVRSNMEIYAVFYSEDLDAELRWMDIGGIFLIFGAGFVVYGVYLIKKK